MPPGSAFTPGADDGGTAAAPAGALGGATAPTWGDVAAGVGVAPGGLAAEVLLAAQDRFAAMISVTATIRPSIIPVSLNQGLR